MSKGTAPCSVVKSSGLIKILLDPLNEHTHLECTPVIPIQQARDKMTTLIKVSCRFLGAEADLELRYVVEVPGGLPGARRPFSGVWYQSAFFQSSFSKLQVSVVGSSGTINAS